MAMDVLAYRIVGAQMQFAAIALGSGQARVGEAGSLMYPEERIERDSVVGDGSGGCEGLFFATLPGPGSVRA